MATPADDAARSRLWWTLFTRNDVALRQWTCLRSWRAVALRKKRRFTKLTMCEQLHIEFVEEELPLHDIVSSIGACDAPTQVLRFTWVRSIVDEQPTACEAMDRHQRVALYYALTQHWCDLDQLLWLVAKSESMLLRKDAEGRSLMTQAVLHRCAQEVVMAMAVELARRSLESVAALLDGRHFESARRLCQRMVTEFFAGVPHFPHALCLELLRTSASDSSGPRDVPSVLDRLQTVWRDFVDTWGYVGTPVVVVDLPPVRHVVLDACLQLVIRAKGEPLTYQWYCDSEPIAGATQATLFVSQSAQPHNAGVYYCEVLNWKGRVVSSSMQLVVVDDRHGPDPSLRFLLSDRERVTVAADNQTVHRVTASRGGLVHATLPSGTIMEGCALLLPPKSFSSFDAHGVDVSDTVGMDVVVRPVALSHELVLGSNETLVSLVIDVLPVAMPALTQPAILSIPHAWCAEADPLYELVVVEIPMPSDAVTDRRDQKTYQAVDHERVLETTHSRRQHGVASFEVSHFGRFAVITRSQSAVNKENDKPLDDVVLVVAHPRRLSSAAAPHLHCAGWLALNRPDTIATVQQRIQERSKNVSDSTTTTTSALRLPVREGHVLHIRIGRNETIEHVWRGSSGSRDGVVCLRDGIALGLHELATDPHDELRNGDDSGSVFRVLELHVVVLKPTRYQSTSTTRTTTTRALHRSTSSSSMRNVMRMPDGLVLSEKDWKILVPVLHDAPAHPPTPRLDQRRPTQLALAYDRDERANDAARAASGVAGGRGHGGGGYRPVAVAVALFDELHESERAFSPYFFQLEIARFSASFWERYDRTWWFDKTKADVLQGMYRVAHSGTEPFTVIATDAFAGAIRVVRSSLDAISAYSEPLLLEPPTDADTVDEASRDGNIDDNDEAAQVPIGLQRTLTLAPSLDLSPHAHASLERLRVVLCDVYGTMSPNAFVALCGVENTFDAVRTELERQRCRVRAAHREVALLVVAMDRLALHLHERVFLRPRCFRRVWTKLGLLRRLVPEIDCFPVEHSAVTFALHELVRDLFEIVWAGSSPGWLARLVRNDTGDAELQAIVSRALRLLLDEAQSLQGANDMVEALETFLVDGDDVGDDGAGLALERHALDALRGYLLLVLGNGNASCADVTEIAALVRQFVPRSVSVGITPEDWDELVAHELQSDAMARALQHLRDHDTLVAHIRSTTPRDQDRLDGPAIPTRLSVRFDVHVVAVDTRQALKVTNATLRCNVPGQIEFVREQRRLVFVPALPFDKHTRYQVKLRAQYVHTALGGALPAATTVTIEFATAA